MKSFFDLHTNTNIKRDCIQQTLATASWLNKIIEWCVDVAMYSPSKWEIRIYVHYAIYGKKKAQITDSRCGVWVSSYNLINQKYELGSYIRI